MSNDILGNRADDVVILLVCSLDPSLCLERGVTDDDRFFKTLTDQVITVELKNDLSITGTLKSVDQYVCLLTSVHADTSSLLPPRLEALRLLMMPMLMIDS